MLVGVSQARVVAGESTGQKRRGEPHPENLGPPWPKGVSGNPGGRTNRTPFADAYRKFARMSGKQLESLDTRKLTGAELVALAQLKAAMGGKTPPAVEAADRAEGKVPLALSGHDGGALFPDDDAALDAKLASFLDRAKARQK